MVVIRRARAEDLSAITEIYNEAVLKTIATFDTKPKTVAEQRIWFEGHGPRHPVFVAEYDGPVAGWASLSEWSGRCAYCDTGEISVYVKESFQKKGIGRKLVETVMNEGRKLGFHTVLARIAAGNDVSAHIFKSAGFEPVGIMREVGRKFGKLINVQLMQKIYENGTP